MSNDDPEMKLKKAHVRLMKNRLTAPYIGAILLGNSSLDEKIPTAGTDGINKIYGKKWVEAQSMAQMCGGVLHENLHVFLKQIPRHLDLVKENRLLANAAMDYVVNDLIMQIHEQDKQLVELPQYGLWDVKFRNWSTREVYHFLKKGVNNQGKKEGQPRTVMVKVGKDGQVEGVIIDGKEYKLVGQDEHDEQSMADATPEQVREILGKISEAIHQGGLLAGRMGMEIPRALKDAMEPEVDWRDETREFVSQATRGTDEYTFARFNRRRLADDFYLPSTESERIGEVVVAIDTSGSIGQEQLDEFGAELASICESCKPDCVRILWWDVTVHAEQVFDDPDNFSNIRSLLKPVGGGGTCVSCVSHYLKERKLDADCVMVFTDGYLESDISWEIKIPTLWLVTQNHSFFPPVGKVVKYRGRS